MYTLSLVLALCSLSIAYVYAAIVQVQVVHRHGARQHLRKNATNPGQEGGAALIPAGAQQLTYLGNELRKRYLLDPSNRIQDSSTEYKSGLDILSLSSDLDRTLSSARAFLNGLYPRSYIIPTSVYAKAQNDWRLRGYTICPTFTEGVQQFLDSPQFKKKAAEEKQFLETHAKRIDENDASLANVFNIYDRYKLKRDGHGAEAGIQDVPDISDADWARLKALADWVEANKYDYNTAGSFVGGGLLNELLQRAADMVNSRTSPRAHRFIEYSAHYPTILGLLASMNAKNDAHTVKMREIPDFAAAIIWELHLVNGKYYIQMLWYTGGAQGNFETLGVGRQPCKDASKACPFTNMQRMFAEDTYANARVFCDRCKTDPAKSLICFAGETSNKPEKQNNSSATEGGTDRTKWVSGTVGALIGLILGLLIALAYMVIMSRRKRRRMRTLAGTLELGPSPYQDSNGEAKFNAQSSSSALPPYRPPVGQNGTLP